MLELIKIDRGTPVLDRETSERIADFEQQIKILKDREEKLKQMILEEMEAKNIIRIDTDDLLISYVSPTDKETFDLKNFKKDCPKTYNAYVRMTPVKSSIRIKVK